MAKLDAVLTHLELEPGELAWDAGCGAGELLVRVAERGPVTGIGVDASPVAIEAARERARRRVPDADLTFVCGDAGEHLPGTPAGLAACVGSSHALGGLDPALRTLAGAVRPGGWVLLGEGYWRRPPSDAYLEVLGGTRDELLEYSALLTAGEAHGLRTVMAVRASDDDWDAYEWTLIANGSAYAARHPDEPGIDRLVAWVDRARARYGHPDGSDTLGFALVLMRAAA